VSIITSVFKGDAFIKGFMEDITAIERFDEYELILINANSPHKEEAVIAPYLEQYPNIIYVKLDKDPGLYGVWNYAIRLARAPYITNSNLDDRRNPVFLESQIAILDEEPSIDLVYSDYHVTYRPHETFAVNTHAWSSDQKEFSIANSRVPIAGTAPLWRKNAHDRFGWFREDFVAAADWDYWTRMVLGGALFKKVHGYGLLMYFNPDGLSTSTSPTKAHPREREESFVRGAYGALWNELPSDSPLLLIKIPTRGRTDRFFKQLDLYYRNLSGNVRYHFLTSCDKDDMTMNNPAIRAKLAYYPNLTVRFKANDSKVAAVNDGLNEMAFDVVLVASDDMQPVVRGFDEVIMREMRAAFPDYDGVFNYHDGHVGGECITYPVIGKAFYKRFGYAYNPLYKSLFANEELTMIARKEGKEKISSTVLLYHLHPAFKEAEWDELYIRNEGLKEVDRQVFDTRRVIFAAT